MRRDQRIRRLAGLAILLGILAAVQPGLAYGHGGPRGGAHRLLNQLALEEFIANLAADDPIFAHYDFSPVLSEAGVERIIELTGPAVTRSGLLSATEGERIGSFAWWVREGGYSGDAPEIRMGSRHFFDPARANGDAYLTDLVGQLFSPRIDAVTWALTAAPYSWEAGQSFLTQAAAAADLEGRNRHWARAWRSLGETLHVLADLTVPAHVRNDAHSPLLADPDPYEETIDAAWISDLVKRAGAGWKAPQAAAAALEAARSPEEILLAVADYTNRHFFSADTISGCDPATGAMVANRNHEAAYVEPSLASCRFEAVTGFYLGADERGPIRLAERSTGGRISVTTACVHSQAERLIPLAVSAGARLIGLYLPRVRVLIQEYEPKRATARLSVEGAGGPAFSGVPPRFFFAEGKAEGGRIVLLKPAVRLEDGTYLLDLGKGSIEPGKKTAVGIDLGGIMVWSAPLSPDR